MKKPSGAVGIKPKRRPTSIQDDLIEELDYQHQRFLYGVTKDFSELSKVINKLVVRRIMEVHKCRNLCMKIKTSE